MLVQAMQNAKNNGFRGDVGFCGIRKLRLTPQAPRRRPRGAPIGTKARRPGSQPRQGRNRCRVNVHRGSQPRRGDILGDDAAPDGAGNSLPFRFYKDAAPLALPPNAPRLRDGPPPFAAAQGSALSPWHLSTFVNVIISFAEGSFHIALLSHEARRY